jgi:hypothetical protein
MQARAHTLTPVHPAVRGCVRIGACACARAGLPHAALIDALNTFLKPMVVAEGDIVQRPLPLRDSLTTDPHARLRACVFVCVCLCARLRVCVCINACAKQWLCLSV